MQSCMCCTLLLRQGAEGSQGVRAKDVLASNCAAFTGPKNKTTNKSHPCFAPRQCGWLLACGEPSLHCAALEGSPEIRPFQTPPLQQYRPQAMCTNTRNDMVRAPIQAMHSLPAKRMLNVVLPQRCNRSTAPLSLTLALFLSPCHFRQLKTNGHANGNSSNGHHHYQRDAKVPPHKAVKDAATKDKFFVVDTSDRYPGSQQEPQVCVASGCRTSCSMWLCWRDGHNLLNESAPAAVPCEGIVHRTSVCAAATDRKSSVRAAATTMF